MKKLILLLLLIPVFSFAQTPISKLIYTVGNDTISSITTQDTLYWRMLAGGVPAGAWNTVSTDYISAAEKTGETTQVFKLAGETDWTYGESIEFKIVAGARVATSDVISIYGAEGALTLFVVPDTVGTNTMYYMSRLVGK